MIVEEEMVTVHWKEGLAFAADVPSGAPFVMDQYPEEGEVGLGPTPFEAFTASIAACSAYDVMVVMAKKRQKVTSYRVEIEGDRGPAGVYPRPYTNLRLRHILVGEGLDEAAVAQAVRLSDEKYCSCIATLRESPAVASVYEVHEVSAATGS
ncbi:MAG: OsmC family protein [Fimbriimonadaceae bacterium]|nr:OsmC family protein [Fimbriimonadaceae bacterium]